MRGTDKTVLRPSVDHDGQPNLDSHKWDRDLLAAAPAAVTLAEEFAKALALTHAKLGDIYEVLAGHVENIDCEKPLDEDSPEFALASAWGLAGAASAHIAALLDRHLPNWRDHE